MSLSIPYLKGEARLVCPPEPAGAKERWFLNDHCFITDRNGTLHMVGINDPYPPEGKRLYDYHPYLGHATSIDPLTAWERQPFVLDDSRGEEYLGAPFIIWEEQASRYLMVFEAKHDGRRGLELAWSPDLTRWERSRKRLPADLPEFTRDPCIVRSDEGEYLIYLCTSKPASSVSVIRTADFKSFSRPDCCLHIDDGTPWGGLESPFVLRRNGLFYLFVTFPQRHYCETLVIPSDRPNRFPVEDLLTTLHAHAAEIVPYRSRWLISSCGPEGTERFNRHGLYLAELGWAQSM